MTTMAAETINHAGSVNVQDEATIQIGDHYEIHNHGANSTVKNEDLRKNLLYGLRTCNYRERKDRDPERTEDTCVWFTSHELFQRWQQQTSALL